MQYRNPISDFIHDHNTIQHLFDDRPDPPTTGWPMDGDTAEALSVIGHDVGLFQSGGLPLSHAENSRIHGRV